MNNQKIAKKIKEKYVSKEVTKVEQLRALDSKAKKPATIFAYVFGTISSLIFGLGMSIAMKVILSNHMILGIVIGIIGLICMVINYPIYKKILNKSTKKYASQIISLSNEIINEA